MMLFEHREILCNGSLKTIETLRIIKINCSKYSSILKKLKKIIKDAPKMAGNKCTSSKYLNLYINSEKQCLKAVKKNGYYKRNGKKISRRTVNIR